MFAKSNTLKKVFKSLYFLRWLVVNLKIHTAIKLVLYIYVYIFLIYSQHVVYENSLHLSLINSIYLLLFSFSSVHQGSLTNGIQQRGFLPNSVDLCAVSWGCNERRGQVPWGLLTFIEIQVKYNLFLIIISFKLILYTMRAPGTGVGR